MRGWMDGWMDEWMAPVACQAAGLAKLCHVLSALATAKRASRQCIHAIPSQFLSGGTEQYHMILDCAEWSRLLALVLPAMEFNAPQESDKHFLASLLRDTRSLLGFCPRAHFCLVYFSA